MAAGGLNPDLQRTQSMGLIHSNVSRPIIIVVARAYPLPGVVAEAGLWMATWEYDTTGRPNIRNEPPARESKPESTAKDTAVCQMALDNFYFLEHNQSIHIQIQQVT